MTFNRKEIKPIYIGIIDIGTYKIRVGICKILNRNVELIGYGEKRQDTNDINLQEIIHLENVCENINQAIEKAQNDAKIKINEFIINFPSQNLFFESSKINYIRENIKEEINNKELYEILKNIELQAFKNHYKRIKNSTGFDKNDLKLIISNFSNLRIDDKNTKTLIGTKPNEIHASILNIFITENNFELKNYISKYIKKDIINIIPTEYALLGLFNEQKNIVIIDLGNSHTSIIIKKDNDVLGAKKLPFGIEDLIKQIRKNYNLTKNDIIQKIDENVFENEKIIFLEIFKDIIAISLDEILKKEICPENFFMAGGGANKFIKKYLENTTFENNELKLAKKIKFLSPKIDFIDDKITENPEWIDGVKSNINMYAMIKATLDFIKKDKSKFERIIKEIVEDIK